MQQQLNVIKLMDKTLSNDAKELLQLGLSFCPVQNLDKFTVIKDLNLFTRKLLLKVIYDKDKKNVNLIENDDILKGFSVQDFRNLKTLMQLLEEHKIAKELENPSADTNMDSLDYESGMIHINSISISI